jgi:tRNA(Ile)-lysidine synthase
VYGDLEKTVSEFIRRHAMFADARGVLIAVSGGADSVALMHVLASLHAGGDLAGRLVCGHVNHRLREQADGDKRFVVDQAAGLGLPVVARTVDVRSHAEANGLSIETAARQLRLAALDEIAREQGCSWIATGHQKNDTGETVIHRLRRGTGFRGLAGIHPVRKLTENLLLASPLLCVARDEIARFLRERNLPWREDPTNADLAYTRNYIRHRLLPSLQPQSHRPLVEDLSELAAAAGRLYDRVQREAEHAASLTAQVETDKALLDASKLTSLPEIVAVEVIRRTLACLGCGERDLTERHYRAILQSARPDSGVGAVSLPGGFVARPDRGWIVLRKCSGASQPVVCDQESTLTIPGRTCFAGYEIEAEVLNRGEIDPTKLTADKDPFCEHLDWDRIRPPVVVRPRRPGDRFQPLGLDAVKKVGKFLTAAATPRDVRDRTLLFADREKILWVCPIRMAEPVKITATTRRVLRLTVRRDRPGQTSAGPVSDQNSQTPLAQPPA